jgi:hypothetical protein
VISGHSSVAIFARDGRIGKQETIMKFKTTAAILGLAALAAGPLPLALIPFGPIDAAFADNGKGNGNGNGGSQGGSAATKGNSANVHAAKASGGSGAAEAKGPMGKGALASELKGLNAVRANPNALDHAAPNSQVGRIAAYRDAAELTLGAAAALQEAEDALAALEVPTRGTDAIDAEIAALDPEAAGYAEALAALEAERANVEAYAEAAAAVEAAAEQLAGADEAEKAALLIASGGRELSEEAIAYLRDMLNL